MRLPLLALLLVLVGAGPAPGGGEVTGKVLAIRDRTSVTPEDVYVWLEPLDRTKIQPGETRQIVQQNQAFVPHIVVVPVGTTVWFPNLDKEEHNVFSPTDPVWDLERFGTSAKGRPHTFEDDGEMDVYCDIHQKMWAKVMVAKSNHIAQVGKDGTFTISGVPAGRYKLVAWAPFSRPVSETVVVTNGATTTAAELHVQLGKAAPHLRKDGQPYKCPPYCPN